MDENENKGLKTYESPSTKKTQVELEGNLCGSTSHTAQSPGNNYGSGSQPIFWNSE